MNSIRYFVNKDKGIVTAKFTFDPVDDIIVEVLNLFRKSGFEITSKDFDKDFANILKKYTPNFKTLYGVAKTNFEGGDEFDVEYGKKLARDRLVEKMNILRYNILSSIWCYILDNNLMKFYHAIDNKYKQIKEVVDDES